MKRRLLVVDDEPNVHYSFQRALEKDYEIRSAFDGAQALTILAAEPIDAVLLDLRMPNVDGLAVLERLREIRIDVPVFVMTAFATTETVIRATALAARDFLSKPVDVPALRRMLAEAMPHTTDEAADAPPVEGVGGLVGASAVMHELYKQIGRAAAVDSTVLVTGESGTGKELVARAIHAHGPRRNAPLVAVNCAAIPAELLESELFGHEKGAFTGATERRPGKFEQADGGTLMLDEIGDMAPALQVKLLRVLQSREVTPLGSAAPRALDVRVVASTNADIEGLVERGAFREDLYYRLNVFRIPIPPLRERGDDVRLLAETFLRRESARLGRSIGGIEPAAVARLRFHGWPGNVRELENVVAQACLRTTGNRVTEGDVVLGRSGPLGSATTTPPTTPSLDPLFALRSALRDLARAHPGTLYDSVERVLVETALEQTGGNQVQAAKLLGVSRNVLRHRVARYGV